MQTEIPKVGIYRNMPAAQYHALLACSSSFLNRMAEASPAHAMADRMAGREQTKPMKIGEGAHTFLLEPGLIEREYCRAGQCAAITGKGTRCTNSGIVGRIYEGEPTAWYCGVKGHDTQVGDKESRIVLTEDEWNACVGMEAAVRKHDKAAAILNHATDIELSIVWRDKETDVLCKARIDIVCATLAILPDLKTMQSVAPREVYWTCKKRGYYRQLELYNGGMAAHGFQFDDSPIIAVESTAGIWDGTKPAHACAVYRTTDDTLAAAHLQNQKLLRQYAACEKSGVWTAFGNETMDISLSEWDLRQIELEAAA